MRFMLYRLPAGSLILDCSFAGELQAGGSKPALGRVDKPQVAC